MITAVKLQGFQSHVDSYFNLGEGLNVITGPSDAGKTAIMRAIRWVAFNEPQGEAFVNEKVGEAVVTIHLSSGAILTKRRRKGKTSYLIQTDEDDEGSLYEKSEVPDEVKALLQIEKQTFGDFETALNFAFQLDAPFLISETASAGAKILGKLAGTESVDLAIKGIRQDTHYTRLERTNAEKDIERIAGSMLAYARIDDAKEAVDLAEMLMEQIEANNTKYEGLREARNLYEAFTERLQQFTETLDRLAIVPQLEEDLKDIEKAQARYDLLLDCYARHNQLAETIERLDEKLLTYKDIEQAAAATEELSTDLERLALLTNLSKAYQKHTEDHIKTVAVLEKTRDLPAAADLLQTISWGLDQVNDLKILSLEYVGTRRRAQEAQERVGRFQGVTEAESILNATGEEMERLALLKKLKSNYFHTEVNVLRQAAFKLKQAEDDLQQATDEEKAAWEAAGGICPLCEEPHERGAC